MYCVIMPFQVIINAKLYERNTEGIWLQAIFKGSFLFLKKKEETDCNALRADSCAVLYVIVCMYVCNVGNQRVRHGGHAFGEHDVDSKENVL